MLEWSERISQGLMTLLTGVCPGTIFYGVLLPEQSEGVTHGRMTLRIGVQGYLTGKKTHPPRTLQ